MDSRTKGRSAIVIAVIAALLVLFAAVPSFAAPTAAGYGEASHAYDHSDETLDDYDGYYAEDGEGYRESDKSTIVVNMSGGSSLGSYGFYAKYGSYISVTGAKYAFSYAIDCGNGSTVPPFSSIYTSAPTYRIMGVAGVDVSLLGPNELVRGSSTNAKMLSGAIDSGDVTPYLSIGNISAPGELASAFRRYGVGDYNIITKYGKKIAVFGIMSKSAFEDGAGGITLKDPLNSATEIADAIKGSGAEVVVCVVYEYGPDDDTAEEIASKVGGVDLVVRSSGGSADDEIDYDHGTPIVKLAGGNTVLMASFTTSAAADGRPYGLSDSVITDLGSRSGGPMTTEKTNEILELTDSTYFSKYGYTYSQKLTSNQTDMSDFKALKSTSEGAPLGDLISDAYISAASGKVREKDGMISAVSTGALSKGLKTGDLTVADVYTMFRAERQARSAGGNLVYTSLSGKELKKILERSSDLVSSGKDRRIFFGGVTFKYTAKAEEGSRVSSVKLLTEKGKGAGVKDDKTYTLVTDQITAAEMSRMLDGKIEFSSAVKADGGASVTAWKALADKLASFGSGGVPEKYASSSGRVIYDDSAVESEPEKEKNDKAEEPEKDTKPEKEKVKINIPWKKVLIGAGLCAAAFVAVLLIILLVRSIARGGMRPKRGGKKKVFSSGRYPRRRRVSKRMNRKKSIFNNKRRRR